MCNNVIPQCSSNSFSIWVTSVNRIVLFCGWQGVVMIACKPFIMEVLFMNFTYVVKGDTSSNYMWYVLELCIITLQQASPSAFESAKGIFNHNAGST